MEVYIDKAKRLFKRLTVREKLLVLLFTGVLFILWMNSFFGRLSTWNDGRKLASTELEVQAQWLANEDAYARGLERALERVDPEKTYSASQLSGRIDSLLRQTGLATVSDIDPVRSREGEIFNDHNLRVQLKRISIAQLIELNKLLTAETPYINLQSVRINANRRNPEELDARFEINSFELKNQTP